MLYVHGWSDYFFNAKLAEFCTAAGARFFALDLRKYGRSLRPGQTPGYSTELAAYDADVDAALAAMGDRTEMARRMPPEGHPTARSSCSATRRAVSH